MVGKPEDEISSAKYVLVETVRVPSGMGAAETVTGKAVGQSKLEDSNMANYGSIDHKSAEKKAALTEKQFAGVGKQPGIEIWRVENRRGENGAPIFGIKRWPRQEYGNFYEGDSYIILNTYKKGTSNKLSYDAHFWLGEKSTQDEIGVAAKKTVELDTLLDGAAIQHREVSAMYFIRFGKF